jgi:hypothetical protein
MLQEQTLKCMIIFMITVKCVHNLEILISKTKDDTNQTVEHLQSFHNKSYEIPLFQIRYLTVRTHSNDFHRNKSDDRNVIGFKFQIRSTLPNVVIIRKEVNPLAEKMETTNIDTFLVEDLFICEY